MRTTTIRLLYSGEYDWPATLRFLAARAVEGIDEVDGELYRRTIRLDAQTGFLQVTPDAETGALRATLLLPSAVDERAVEARLRRMFDLDADLTVINAHLAADPALAALVAARPAMRVFGGWDGFEVALRTINGQQVSVERARRLNSVLVARCRAGSTGSHKARCIFPTPEQVLDADLAGMGMPGARVAALKAVAEAAVADPLLFGTDGPLDDTIARLLAIRGIGEWTAHYIAMRACRQPDAFPASDVGLLRGAADEAGRRPSPESLRLRAEAWRPWRAYAAHHLWAADSAARSGVRRAAGGATVAA